MSSINRLRLSIGMWLIVAGTAAAQTENPDQEVVPEGETESPSDDILAGPEVQEEDSALPPDFSGSSDRGSPIVIPPEQWMSILRSLDLTDEQAADVSEIEEEVRQAMLEFRAEYGEELREIDRTRRESNDRGERLPPELQRRFVEINREMPSLVEAQERLWLILDDGQKAQMSEQLEQMRRRIMEERERRFAQEMVSDRPMETTAPPEMEPRTQPDDEAEGLDEAGQRRLRFLRERQLERPRGAPPSERDFQFRDGE